MWEGERDFVVVVVAAVVVVLLLLLLLLLLCSCQCYFFWMPPRARAQHGPARFSQIDAYVADLLKSACKPRLQTQMEDSNLVKSQEERVPIAKVHFGRDRSE